MRGERFILRFVKGEGWYVYDTIDRQYLDGFGTGSNARNRAYIEACRRNWEGRLA